MQSDGDVVIELSDEMGDLSVSLLEGEDLDDLLKIQNLEISSGGKGEKLTPDQRELVRPGISRTRFILSSAMIHKAKDAMRVGKIAPSTISSKRCNEGW